MPDLAIVDHAVAYSEKEISTVAKKILKAGKDNLVWALQGAMGAGKTTLVKAVMAELSTNETVASPTFSIVNEYRSNRGTVYHFDFYRIKNEMEAYDIGTDEYFESGDLCLVEWPEKIPSLLPPTYFEIHLEIIDEQTRLIRYRNHG